MSVHNRIRKMLLIILAVITGTTIATAVGVKVYRFHFEGRDTEGAYHFSTPQTKITGTYVGASGEDKEYHLSQSRMAIMASSDPEMQVEEKQAMLEEIETLRRNDQRELVGVVDKWVNGQFSRIYRYCYTLSNGRTKIIGGSDPDARASLSPEQLERDHAEIDRLREWGERELSEIVEYNVEGVLGRIFTYEYVLSDGRVKTFKEKDPKTLGYDILSSKQIEEVWRLYGLKRGEFQGILDRKVHDMTFACETYLFTLDDGTVVTLAKGQPKNRKTRLTKADRKELLAMRVASSGEDLESETKEVRGETFVFERQRYILSDGTEVVLAVGKPVD